VLLLATVPPLMVAVRTNECEPIHHQVAATFGMFTYILPGAFKVETMWRYKNV